MNEHMPTRIGGLLLYLRDYRPDQSIPWKYASRFNELIEKAIQDHGDTAVQALGIRQADKDESHQWEMSDMTRTAMERHLESIMRFYAGKPFRAAPAAER